MTTEERKAITNNTTITLGSAAVIVVTLLGSAFWFGADRSEAMGRINANTEKINRLEIDMKERLSRMEARLIEEIRKRP